MTSGVIQGSLLGPLLFSAFIWDLPQCFTHADCSKYADDTKVFFNVSNVSDCVCLQNDINSLCNWCTNWGLDLNLEKCAVISFTKKKNPLNYQYSLGGSNLVRITQVTDLGVILTPDLNFDSHISSAVARALRLLGLIRRSCSREFSGATVRRLYLSLVRPMVEYASAVWSPHHANKVGRLERVQRCFLNFYCYKSGIKYVPRNYIRNCLTTNLHTLKARREIIDLMCFYKILHSQFDCSSLLSEINISAPARRTRLTNIFRPYSARVDVFKFDFLNRVQNCYNLLSQQKTELDIFAMSVGQFKHSLLAIYK